MARRTHDTGPMESHIATDQFIGPADAARLVASGEAILIDVTESGAWALLREVPAGSLRITPGEFRERVAELPRERTLITYCT